MKKIMVFLGLILTILLLSACGEKQTRHVFESMDTTISVEIYGAKKELFEEVEDVFVYYSQLSTKHRRNEVSESHKYYNLENIFTINANAGVSPVEVKEELIELVEFGLELYELSDGYFNIGVGHLVDLWKDVITGYMFFTEDAYDNKVIEAQQIGEIDLNKVIINRENKTIYLEDDSVQLDLGALSKGYALQKAVDLIESKGIKKYRINAGSSSIAYGLHPENRGYIIGIKDAFNKYENGYFIKFETKNNSLSTSGNSEQFLNVLDKNNKPIQSKMIHHIISPFTFKPENFYHSVTLIGKDAGLLDALSTAIFLMDQEKAITFLNTHELDYVFYMTDYSVLTNLKEDEFEISKLK